MKWTADKESTLRALAKSMPVAETALAFWAQAQEVFPSCKPTAIQQRATRLHLLASVGVAKQCLKCSDRYFTTRRFADREPVCPTCRPWFTKVYTHECKRCHDKFQGHSRRRLCDTCGSITGEGSCSENRVCACGATYLARLGSGKVQCDRCWSKAYRLANPVQYKPWKKCIGGVARTVAGGLAVREP